MWQKNQEREGKVANLLMAGLNLSQIAKRVNKSPAAILKRARKYEREGKIERIARGIYRKKETANFTPPISPLPSLPQPIMLPAKFGGIFAQIGKPKLIYDDYGKAYEETALFKAQFGRHKTQIWLKGGFTGNTVQERITNGHKQLEAIAASLAAKHGITLTLIRWYEDIEWIDPSKERSKATASGIGMRRGERVRVAGALHKYSDFSHPEQVQFNALPNGDKKRPTSHAEIRERLYSGEYERRFDMVMTALERMTEVLEEVKIRMDIKKEAKP